MFDNPFDSYEKWLRILNGELPEYPRFEPYYPYHGVFTEHSSPLPKGFVVEYENAKYYPLFDGASYRVVLDFGNGTVTFYPSGMIQVGDNLEYLKIKIYFEEQLIYTSKSYR
ncbi:MAG TPA: hypothetical protein VF837_03945 [Patescibacteria group bacterium]